MIILLHTSKTMRTPGNASLSTQQPLLLARAIQLADYIKTLDTAEFKTCMHVSEILALKTQALFQEWNTEPPRQRPAIDSFVGDIYSGLQVPTWSDEDRRYADSSLRILSGLYGLLRPLDGIYPYRLEMGYRLPEAPFSNLYSYWGDVIAKTLPRDEPIINLAAKEYSKVVTDFISSSHITAPSFLTLHPKTHEPTFVVVHAKIARGAFAAWLIKNRITDLADLKSFQGLGYRYNASLSSSEVPVFVCQKFGGLGLSIRLL